MSHRTARQRKNRRAWKGEILMWNRQLLTHSKPRIFSPNQKTRMKSYLRYDAQHFVLNILTADTIRIRTAHDSKSN